MRWTWHIALIGERRSTYVVLMGGNLKKRLLGRPRHRRYDNIRRGLRVTE
jgi:hypothetical protein